ESDGERAEPGWRRPPSYGRARGKSDHYGLDPARAAGGDVGEGAGVTAVTEDTDGVRVVSPHGTFTASVVIGAGGHRCPVAHALGEVSEREEVVVAQESETRLSPAWVEALARWWDAPELYVEPDLKGYGWYFPKGAVLNVGVGCVVGPGADLPGRREALVSALRAAGRLPADLPIEPFRGHAYVVRRRAPRKLAGERFC